MNAFNQDQLKKLQSRLNSIPNAITANVKPTIKASGDALVAEMKRLAPKDTGELRDSISAKPGTDGNVSIEVASPHALQVEFGNRHAPAQPFFLPAIRTLHAKIVADVKKAVIAAVQEPLDK